MPPRALSGSGSFPEHASHDDYFPPCRVAGPALVCAARVDLLEGVLHVWCPRRFGMRGGSRWYSKNPVEARLVRSIAYVRGESSPRCVRRPAFSGFRPVVLVYRSRGGGRG